MMTTPPSARAATQPPCSGADASPSGPALRLSGAQLSGILDIASEAIVSVDDEQRIVLFNQGAEQIFGYGAAEIMGRPLNLLIPARFHAKHRRHVQHFGEAPVVARLMGERGDVEIIGVRKNGEEFPAEASISKLDAGGCRIYTAVLRDVTERRRAERAIAELLERERIARAEAEAASRARDDVLRVVSHDLGTPLSAVTITTSVLLRTLPEEDEATRTRVLGIRHLAEQMQRLRQDLLDVTSLEAGGLSVEAHPREAAALLEEAWEQAAPLAAEKPLRLELRPGEDLPPVLADRERVLQVLANLLGNAIKFTPAGGEVMLSAEPAPGGVRFYVRDTGMGIAADDLPHVFDRFWQARRANRAGAGLGLAIARGIVEVHGGTIHAESREGEGSTFAFTLPAVAPPGAAPSAARSAPARSGG